MNLFGKISLSILVVLGMMAIGYGLDRLCFTRAEDTASIPDIGIKGATLEPKFVTANGQPIILVFIKGQAKSVSAEIAKRVAPTKGGEPLANVDLEKMSWTVPAAALDEKDTGDLSVWAKTISVPADVGQYLLTLQANDMKDASTRFKMFNAILSVQDVPDKIISNSPGQSTVLEVLKKSDKLDDVENTALFSSDFSQTEQYSQLRSWLKANTEAKAVEFTNSQLDLVAGQEKLTAKVVGGNGIESSWEISVAINVASPLAKWPIMSLEIN